jgi:hypothetical protein
MIRLPLLIFSTTCGAFLVLKNSLILLFLDTPPEEKHDACTFSLMFLGACPTKSCNPVADASLLERDEGRMQ